MSDTTTDTKAEQTGLRPGSWLGAAVGAAGLGACLTVVTLGGTAIMDEGGFVASGGPYAIEHPTPEGFWLFPVAFVGVVVFLGMYGAFAMRINGFGLSYPAWCAAWTAIGGTTLWYGFNPPSGAGLAWGWIVMGSIFLVVGLGSTWLYVSYLLSPRREPSNMPAGRRLPYAALVLAAIAAGIYLGSFVFGAVIR